MVNLTNWSSLRRTNPWLQVCQRCRSHPLETWVPHNLEENWELLLVRMLCLQKTIEAFRSLNHLPQWACLTPKMNHWYGQPLSACSAQEFPVVTFGASKISKHAAAERERSANIVTGLAHIDTLPCTEYGWHILLDGYGLEMFDNCSLPARSQAAEAFIMLHQIKHTSTKTVQVASKSTPRLGVSSVDLCLLLVVGLQHFETYSTDSAR